MGAVRSIEIGIGCGEAWAGAVIPIGGRGLVIVIIGGRHMLLYRSRTYAGGGGEDGCPPADGAAGCPKKDLKKSKK